MRSTIWLVTLAVALLPAAVATGAGVSGSTSQVSPLALSVVEPGASALIVGPALNPSVTALATPLVAPVRYRPRAYREHGRVMPTTSQVHVGFFDPTDNFSTGFYGGFRVGPQVDPRVQIGLAVDWWHKAESQTVSIDQGPLPGGGTGERRLELSRSSADMIPILGFVQISGDENMAVIPYVGAGVGFAALFLNADDYQSGETFDATYGGFAWQVWGGAGVPLSGRARLNGEVFYNGCEVGRDVDDPFYAATYREIVKMDGVGMRVGVQWGF